MKLYLVPDELVKASITVEECMTAVEEGFRLYATERTAEIAARTLIQNREASVNLYAAEVSGFGLGAKVLTAHEHNPENGEPYIYASVLVLDEETGRPIALLDGRFLTALRTAAATAIGARWLCRPDSQVLGILGSGLQSRTHLLCHVAIHPFQRIVVWARNEEKVRDYVSEMQPQVDAPIDVLGTPEEVAQAADVIACTTRARRPLFSAAAIRPGSHIGVAGPLRSDGMEIPAELLDRAHLFVDNHKKFTSLWASGSSPQVTGELGAVITGQMRGRTDRRDITVFKPVGMAFEDVVSAKIVLDRVREHGTAKVVAW